MNATHITFKHYEKQFHPNQHPPRQPHPPRPGEIQFAFFQAKVIGWVGYAFNENVLKCLWNRMQQPLFVAAYLKGRSSYILPLAPRLYHILGRYSEKIKRMEGVRAAFEGEGQKDDWDAYLFRGKYLWLEKISWHYAYSFGGPTPKISERGTGPVWVGGWQAQRAIRDTGQESWGHGRCITSRDRGWLLRKRGFTVHRNVFQMFMNAFLYTKVVCRIIFNMSQ